MAPDGSRLVDLDLFEACRSRSIMGTPNDRSNDVRSRSSFGVVRTSSNDVCKRSMQPRPRPAAGGDTEIPYIYVLLTY